MAKNILSQKKRVTHINNMSDNQYNDEGAMQSESFDYVYNIMKGMDSTKAVGYNPSDDSLKMELLSLTNDEHTEVLKPPAASTSNDCSQAVKAATIKFKKFSNTRKFPLMEKSQKILKQLKHNRSIPKPRAHLASINMSPRKNFSNTNKSLPNSKKELKQRRVVINEPEKSVKTNALISKSSPVLTAAVINQKSKEVCIVKNKTNLSQVNTKVKSNISAKISKPVVTDINVHKSKELHIVKNVVNDINLKKIPKRCESDNNCMDARQKNLKMGCNINDVFSNKNVQSNELSDGNTTDSEYERFIHSTKVQFEDEIPKKRSHQSRKKKVNQKKKMHSKTKLQKSFPLESPDYLDSNCFDDLSDFDNKKKLERSFSKESLAEHYDSNCYSDSSDGGGKFRKKNSKKSKKMKLKEKKMQKEKLQCKNKLQKCFPLESPDERDSNRLDNSSDHEKNLERNFSKESLVEHYDSNCYSDSSDESEEFEREIFTESKEKQPKEGKMQKKKSNHINKSQESFSLRSSTVTHNSNCLDNLSDCGKKESERIDSRVSLENLVEHIDSNCFNNTSSGEGGEINKKIESAVMKSCENILLNNFKTVDNNMGSNFKNIRKLHCSLNKDEDKSNYYQFENFISEECPNLIEPSNLSSNLDSPVRIEDKNCMTSFKPSTVINETSMNYIQNYSEGIQNTNLHNSSTSKCISVCSKLDKCDEVPVENLVIDLFSSDSEQENTESSQITVQKENFREMKEAQITVSTNVDSAESDIEVIEVVPVSNKNKPVTNCSISGASSDDLNRMTGIDSTNYKTNENEIKFSQTYTFNNIIPKGTEPVVLDTNVSKNMHPSLKVHLNKKLVKKELNIAESNNPVYMTGMCKEYDNEIVSKSNGDPLRNCTAVLKECKLEKCETMRYVNEDDDIMIIESSVNQSVKQEVLDDDVIIDFVSVKKEQNPESTVECSITSKRKNQIYIEDLESKIKNGCPVNCKEAKISSIIDNTSVGKVPIIDCSLTKSLIDQNFSSDPLIISKIMPLIDLYKKEFIMYQEIVRTEENVEAGLRMVEAHQAEKLKCIQSLIQNFVKNNSYFEKIYSDPVKTKEQDPVQLQSFQNYSVDILQASSSKISSEIRCTSSQDSSEGDSSNKLTVSLPSIHIKTEKEEKPGFIANPVCLDISHSVARIKTELDTPLNNQASILTCDVPEDKQALKLLGKKCDVCGKEAVAACQRCAKAFFCSDECGKKFWNDGHERVCDKYV